jgi:RHS repeat-associated protein
LTAASTTGPDWGLSFTYDGFGNRTNQSVTKGSGPAVSLSINLATNRINSSGYTYDANGNLTATPNATLLYDIENRLVKVTSSGSSEYYGHDPWNRGVWKTTRTNGTGNVFFYGAFGELMGTYSFTGSFSKVETNIHFAGKLIRWDNAAVVLDRLVGVKLRSNLVADPPVTQKSNYYPFGEERTATGQDRTKFATYYRDTKTGFDQAMNRYYISQWGRFLTADPYGPSANPASPLSWNRYAYVGNDPSNKNDPSGLDYFFQEDPDWVTQQMWLYYFGTGLMAYHPRPLPLDPPSRGSSERGPEKPIVTVRRIISSEVNEIRGTNFSKVCDSILRLLGTSVSDVVDLLSNPRLVVADGTTSTVAAPRTGWIGRFLDRIFGVPTVGDVFAWMPGGDSLGDPRSGTIGTIYVRPEAILKMGDNYLGAVLFHEATHILTSRTHEDLMRSLSIGLIRGLISGSNSITEEIKKKCFP